MLERTRRSLRGVSRKNLPKHVAISVSRIYEFCQENNRVFKDVFPKSLEKIKYFIEAQIALEIPVFTFHVLSGRVKEFDNFSVIMDCLEDFFNSLLKYDVLFENKVKISVLGKWYNLPSRVVEPIKKMVEETKDYDSFFVNLCINYDGQEEIIDSCRIIGRKIELGKIDPDSIKKRDIKDNLYSSYFLPPDLIIITAGKRSLDGFLLWDSVNSFIYFSERPWPEFSLGNFVKFIQDYQSKQ